MIRQYFIINCDLAISRYDFVNKTAAVVGFRSVVTHRLGSGTGSGCKYRELVSEVRQGAVLNLFLPRMRRTVDFLRREG